MQLLAPTSMATQLVRPTKAARLLKARPLYAGQYQQPSRRRCRSLRRIAQKLLEAEKPHVVFTHWPIDNLMPPRDRNAHLWCLVEDAKSFALYITRSRGGQAPAEFSPQPRGHYADRGPQLPRLLRPRQPPSRGLQELVTWIRGVESGHGRKGFIRQRAEPPTFPPGG